MRVLILCGGRGERFLHGDPKPLNRACGKRVGQWMFESLLKYSTFEDIVWVLNPKLYTYDIENVILEWTSKASRPVSNTFLKLPYETRDPSETLELALNMCVIPDSFLCLDNDNIYTDGLDQFRFLESVESAILVSEMRPDKIYEPRYGFLRVEEDQIVDGREKMLGWGENAWSCGGYWFASQDLALSWLGYQRCSSTTSGERSLLNLIIRYSKATRAVKTRDSFSIGTPQDCIEAQNENPQYFGWHQARIACQDIPVVRDWLLEKKCEISSHSPDVYIHTDTVNPFNPHWNLAAGDWTSLYEARPMNSLPVTRKVAIQLRSVEHVLKTGTLEELAGQKYYYEFLASPSGAFCRHLFPLCYNIVEETSQITLDLEYIKGVPGSYLWCYDSWGRREFEMCVNALNLIHSNPSSETFNLRSNYIQKVQERIELYPVYRLLDFDLEVWNLLVSKIENYHPTVATQIHGDSFLGNILFSMKGQIKFIDMRGKVGSQLTVYGDPNYDWAKLCTSFLGMDACVYNLPQDDIENGLNWITQLPEDPKLLVSLALILMYGSMAFYPPAISSKIFDRIKYILGEMNL